MDLHLDAIYLTPQLRDILPIDVHLYPNDSLKLTGVRSLCDLFNP